MKNVGFNASGGEVRMLKDFVDTAVYGLYHYYKNYDKNFHYTVKRQAEDCIRPEGYSLRYAAISHIGISKWLACRPWDRDRLPSLWGDILNELPKTNDIGDVALCLWAGCEGAINEKTEIIANRLLSLWKDHQEKCNSVELGWVLKACLMVRGSMPELGGKVDSMMRESYLMLIHHYHSTAGLFCRHRRQGFKQKISGQIACFADQVYPIVAMSHYGRLFDDKKAKSVASQVVAKICEYQGSLGQWMWHYDVVHNRLCEAYPVFSVHQHSMAPMAIFASDDVNGEDHNRQIELGAKWLLGDNELGENLIVPEQGVIWRDIERREPEKRTRNIKGLCYTYGMKPIGDLLTRRYDTYKVNYECRPYELGWILYAWADKFAQEVIL